MAAAVNRARPVRLTEIFERKKKDAPMGVVSPQNKVSKRVAPTSGRFKGTTNQYHERPFSDVTPAPTRP
jgi:hypothetical protein